MRGFRPKAENGEQTTNETRNRDSALALFGIFMLHGGFSHGRHRHKGIFLYSLGHVLFRHFPTQTVSLRERILAA